MAISEKLKSNRVDHGLVEQQSEHEDRAAVLRPGCIARQYAQCDDLAHCRYCTTIEQALRAAYWFKLKWPRVGGRHSF